MVMNPLEPVEAWLDEELAAKAAHIIETGERPTDETERYELAYSMSLELEQLELASRQLQFAESRWRDERHPSPVFSRGMVKIRQEVIDVAATRLQYKRALRILRLTQQRKKLRNALFDAAVQAHASGYDADSMCALSEANAAWAFSLRSEQAEVAA